MLEFQKYTSITERAIARELIGKIFSVPGRYVQVNDGEETTGVIIREESVYQHLATTGSDWIIVFENGERIGAIWLVWGNGEDLITDYSDNEKINAIVEPVLESFNL